MRNALLALLGVGVLALGGYAAAGTLDDATPARSVSLPAAGIGETTTGETTTTGATTTIDGTDDVSGPCDETEHANDPRCTGGTATDDNDDDNHDDRSGSNSGRG